MLWHKQALMDFQQELEEAVPIVEAWVKDMEVLGVKHSYFSVEMLVQVDMAPFTPPPPLGCIQSSSSSGNSPHPLTFLLLLVLLPVLLHQAQGNLGQLGSMLRTIGKARASRVKVNVRAYTHAIYALSKCGQLTKSQGYQARLIIRFPQRRRGRPKGPLDCGHCP